MGTYVPTGIPPQMWDIQVPVIMFQDSKQAIEIPFTSSVATCYECNASGREICDDCKGQCMMICRSCQGSGRFNQTTIVEEVRVDNNHHHHHHHHHHHGGEVREEVIVQSSMCQHCAGMGRIRCGRCFGHGFLRCCGCEGLGMLRFFLELIVTRQTIMHYQVIDYSGTSGGFPAPAHVVAGAAGTNLVDITYPACSPLSGFSNEINAASHQLLATTASEIASKQLLQLQQKISLRVIPVSCVQAVYNGKLWHFWVLGSNKEAYAPDYPR
jgi:hypothetical protein